MGSSRGLAVYEAAMTRPWIVQSHDAIERHEPELWSVKGQMVGAAAIRRRMFIVRFGDGRLAFLNAVPLREESMREIEAFGAPAFLCIPASYHTLDVAPFKARYPLGGTLCFPGDAVMNIPHFGGLGGLLFRVLGSTGGPRVTRICHGRIIDQAPAETLRAVADAL